MKHFLLIVLFSGLISCDKSEKKIMPDDIYYVNIRDTLITSIDSSAMIWDSPDGCSINYPSDSTVEFNLDVDNDGSADFEIIHSHSYGFCYLIYSPHLCSYENYRIIVKGLKNNKISVDSGQCQIFIPKQINEGDIIGGNDSQWSESVLLLIQGPLYACACRYTSGSNYIGLKFLKENSTYYGWLNVDFNRERIILKEYSINYTDENTIIAGQKK